ncbi:MAG TPA: uracil phosphoribosyltransferase [Bacteroidota bacterium]|nr:uracil phosphoribosyltransferase [Bacteroidota bacterium]
MAAKNLRLIDHPLVRRDLTILRDRRTGTQQFRRALRRISCALACEATRELAVRRGVVHTPMEKAAGYVLARDIVLVPVLRAGLGLLEGFLDMLPDARVGHVGLQRNETTLEPEDYYRRLPGSLRASEVFVLDPMLATGGSGSAAIARLKAEGARRIRFISLVAAPAGVRRLANDHPDVPVYSCSLDRRLNARGYILPGLGDAGDRIFGTN